MFIFANFMSIVSLKKKKNQVICSKTACGELDVLCSVHPIPILFIKELAISTQKIFQVLEMLGLCSCYVANY